MGGSPWSGKTNVFQDGSPGFGGLWVTRHRGKSLGQGVDRAG